MYRVVFVSVIAIKPAFAIAFFMVCCFWTLCESRTYGRFFIASERGSGFGGLGRKAYAYSKEILGAVGVVISFLSALL